VHVPLVLNAVLPFQVSPPVAVQVRAMWPEWLVGRVEGEQVKLGLLLVIV
jgi:hypothetical protein